jgi:hypothetical protein
LSPQSLCRRFEGPRGRRRAKSDWLMSSPPEVVHRSGSQVPVRRSDSTYNRYAYKICTKETRLSTCTQHTHIHLWFLIYIYFALWMADGGVGKKTSNERCRGNQRKTVYTANRMSKRFLVFTTRFSRFSFPREPSSNTCVYVTYSYLCHVRTSQYDWWDSCLNQVNICNLCNSMCSTLL